MLRNYLVPIPCDKGKIFKRKVIRKNGDSVIYVEYERSRTYNTKRKNTSTNRTTIGKLFNEDNNMMYPNDNYYKYVSEPVFNEDDDVETNVRSSCLKFGAYYAIKKIIKDYKLDYLIKESCGEDNAGLFFDLCSYLIVCEDNAAQYYPDYAYNHPLFSDNMHIYSDSYISDYLKNKINIDMRISFIDKWTSRKKDEDVVYLSYDSTNKECEAGDIEIVELGESKNHIETNIFNYSIVFDHENKEPMFYEKYGGSINDVSMLVYNVNKVKAYGYNNICLILDRGYFSKANINYMDDNGIDFLIMCKANKTLVNKLVSSVKGSFEDKYLHHINKFDVNGISIKSKLYLSDKKERYFHVYYSPELYSSSRKALMSDLQDKEKQLNRALGKEVIFPNSYHKYYELVYKEEEYETIDDKTNKIIKNKRNILYSYVPRSEVIDEESSLCGYFVIISSKQMKASEAYIIYKSRDTSEKLFRTDKSYLGNKSLRVHSDESLESKMFMSFVALIIRNKIYNYLIDYMIDKGEKLNYLTVPAAIKELDKIELIKQPNGIYTLDHALSRTQKTILEALNIKHRDLIGSALDLGKKMIDY